MTRAEAAVAYGREYGWRIHPTRGKKPWLKSWPERATSDADQLGGLWEKWPDAGVALATGRASGVVVLDVDPRHGGDEALSELQRRNETIPATVESITGGGGRHLFFAAPACATVRNSNGRLGAGLDIRGERGYVVLPPSEHPNGGSYRWRPGAGPGDIALAALPTWLLDLLKREGRGAGRRERAVTQSGVPIRPGQRNSTLTRRAGAMRRAGWGEAAILAALLAENADVCLPPLDNSEVARVAKSAAGWVAPWLADRITFASDPQLLPNDRWVLSLLCESANAEGSCWPSIRTLARWSGLSKTTVNRCIKRLEATSRIDVTSGGRGMSNRYKLRPFFVREVVQEEEGTPACGSSVPATGTPALSRRAA